MHFTHYSCVVIIFFSTGLSESGFSIYYFVKKIVRLSVFDMFSICSEFLVRGHIYVIIRFRIKALSLFV